MFFHPDEFSWIDGLHIPAWALIVAGGIVYSAKRLLKDFKGISMKVGRIEKEMNEMKQALVAHAYSTGNKDILSFMAKYEAPKEE